MAASGRRTQMNLENVTGKQASSGRALLDVVVEFMAERQPGM